MDFAIVLITGENAGKPSTERIGNGERTYWCAHILKRIGKELIGIVGSHVDDTLHAENEQYANITN